MKKSNKFISKVARKRRAIPLGLHFYAAIIFVLIFFVSITALYIQVILKSYIAEECNKRLDTAADSCQSFASAFRTSITDDYEDPAVVKEYLLNSIVSSADISNEASISLVVKPDIINEYSILWPTANYSISSLNTTNSLINNINEQEGFTASSETKTVIDDNGDVVYYRIMGVEYMPEENKVDTSEDYYLLLSVNSKNYYHFINSLTAAMINAVLIAIIVSGFISILTSYPLLFSTRKLSRFATRISKGNFDPMKGELVSQELNELGDVMNSMAFKLKAADQEQKTFFQNASHELRTPLMSIQGYAEGIKYDVFDDEGRENAIDIIIDETNRLSSMVENLLSISKMDMSKSGNYEVKKKLVNVHELAETAIDRVRGNFILNDKNLINSIKCNNTYIFANENDIYRMLENIFSNCLRYCNDCVSFSCVRDDINHMVVFTISDDGPGISEEVMSHLFERFAKGSDGKHGIGLALAKAIVDEHEGEIMASNNPDGGACFKISIPITEAREQLTNINNNNR